MKGVKSLKSSLLGYLSSYSASERRNVSQGFSSHRNEAGFFSLQQDMYIGESCGVGYQARVLRIATILYSTGGHEPCWFFDTQVESKEKGVGGGRQLSGAAATWEERECECNVCVNGSAPSRFLETGFLPGCFPHVSPERPLAKRLQLGWFLFVILPTPSQFLTNRFRWLGSRIWVGYGNALSIFSFSFNSSSRSALG